MSVFKALFTREAFAPRLPDKFGREFSETLFKILGKMFDLPEPNRISRRFDRGGLPLFEQPSGLLKTRLVQVLRRGQTGKPFQLPEKRGAAHRHFAGCGCSTPSGLADARDRRRPARRGDLRDGAT